MTTLDPPTTAPSEPIIIPATPAVETETSDEAELDPKVAAAKALLKKKPAALVTAGSIDSASTSPESPPPTGDEIEPAAAVAVAAGAEAAAVTAPAPAEDSVIVPLASAGVVVSVEEVGDVQEKESTSDDTQTPLSVSGEYAAAGYGSPWYISEPSCRARCNFLHLDFCYYVASINVLCIFSVFRRVSRRPDVLIIRYRRIVTCLHGCIFWRSGVTYGFRVRNFALSSDSYIQ